MYGRNLLTNNHVQPTRVSADGSPKYKTGGVGIDWSTVAAVAGSDVTLPDGSVIRIGQKYLRYGQIITRITASGLFGPYDPAAADGRQTLTRGEAFILDQTLLQYTTGTAMVSAQNDQVGNVFDGGEVFIDRILNSGGGAASLAAGPTLANVNTTFPGIFHTKN